MMSNFFIFIIKIYQTLLSPILRKIGVRCRFYPTCSDYAILAIAEFGFINGTKKTFNRLRRCNLYNLESCIDFPSQRKCKIRK
jgi:uncharacterized protein